MKKIRILDGTMLKLIAMVSMVFDHVGSEFFPAQLWMRAVGRLAMPIFAFCIAEGYLHTRSRKKYLLRLGLFALVSELPFDLLIYGRPELTHQNIMFTFFLAVLGLMAYDAIRGETPTKGRTALGILVVLCMAAAATVLRGDFVLFAVISVFLFYAPHRKPLWVRQSAGVAFLAVTRTIGYYAATGLSILPLLLYNGKKGRGMKWLFYAFYPGHLLLLYAIKQLIIHFN